MLLPCIGQKSLSSFFGTRGKGASKPTSKKDDEAIPIDPSSFFSSNSSPSSSTRRTTPRKKGRFSQTDVKQEEEEKGEKEKKKEAEQGADEDVIEVMEETLRPDPALKTPTKVSAKSKEATTADQTTPANTSAKKK